VFVERFWRTVKYEEVYFKAYESVAEARPAHARSSLLRLAAPLRGSITRAARVSLQADPRCL